MKVRVSLRERMLPPPSPSRRESAGEQVHVQGSAEVIHAVDSAQMNRLLSWRKSTLYFQDQPLGEVVEELMRYTN